MKYYFDHTELKLDFEEKGTETFVMGGLLIDRSEENELCKLMKEVKAKYTHPDLPIKYNFKDLKAKYIEHNRGDEYEMMLSKSVEWRKELFEKSLKIDYQIIIAVIQSYKSKFLDNKKNKKPEILGFAFADILMRLGMELKDKNISQIQVISDWPESNDPKPFNHNYYYGYSRGHTPHAQDYFCGALNNIGFHDTVLFASMNHSNMLQFADLIIGSSKDFLSAHLSAREYSVGKELTALIIRKFRGFPKNINYGISLPSRNVELTKRVNEIVKPYFA